MEIRNQCEREDLEEVLVRDEQPSDPIRFRDHLAIFIELTIC